MDGNGAATKAGNAGAAVSTCGIDLRLVHGAFEHASAVGEVLQKVDVGVEGDEERLVLGLENALEKLAAGLLFERQHIDLAAGGIEHEPEVRGKVGLSAEVLEGLGDLVFGNGAVVFGEVRNQFAGLAFYGEEKIDEVDVQS